MLAHRDKPERSGPEVKASAARGRGHNSCSKSAGESASLRRRPRRLACGLGGCVVNTRAVIFPFDLFGSGGTRAGAELLADALREMLADNRREKVATRARAYAGKVRIEEYTFDRLEDYNGWRETAQKEARTALDRGDFLLWITGNHLGALPVYDVLSGADTAVVQFDAHL